MTTRERVIHRVSLEERLAKFVEGSANWKEMQSVANTLYPTLHESQACLFLKFARIFNSADRDSVSVIISDNYVSSLSDWKIHLTKAILLPALFRARTVKRIIC